MALTPPSPGTRGSMVPLRGMQLLCCAAVVGVGMHISAGLQQGTDATRIALNALDAARHGDSAVDAAMQAATAGLSEIRVEVKANDTLDQIFRRLQLSMTDLAHIRALDAARLTLDRLRPGDLLTFFTRGEQLVGLMRPLPLNKSLALSKTLRVERNDADQFVASVDEVPLQRNVVTATGTIESGSSLFVAGTNAGLRDGTITALTEVFGWDVDFVLDTRAGDSFTVIHEQLKRDGKVVADGEILAAEFVNDGKHFRAVRYQNKDGKVDFYTPEGVSLRKAFLKVPLSVSRISSVFNPSRRHPVLNTIRAHRGVDYAAPTGTPVHAAGAGRVSFQGVKGGFGNVIEIMHAGKVVTRYGHLSRFAEGQTTGAKVEQGQTIGYVGMTGLATGPHLHFEYIESGVQIDPQKAIKRGEPGPPISTAERGQFAQQTMPLLAQLQARHAGAGTAMAVR